MTDVSGNAGGGGNVVKRELAYERRDLQQVNYQFNRKC